VKRDFLALSDFTGEEHAALFRRAAELKDARRRGEVIRTLEGRTLLLLFEKHSTRTRLSFEAAIGQLGGTALTLPMQDSQISRGESLEDTAAVASRYVDAIMYRTYGDERLRALARASIVPVINGLSDGGHPVQLLADLFTVHERFGSLRERVVAWVGDGASNMARSWIEAARLFGFTLRISAPDGFNPPRRPGFDLVAEPREAVRGADVVTTDVWISMGQEKEAAARRKAFAGYCLDEALLKQAKPSAIVLHCLPAHRGEEISAGVIDGPQSAVLDEAENRLHVQKALLEALILRR
jgi:ornithine carbamoyltransferase